MDRTLVFLILAVAGMAASSIAADTMPTKAPPPSQAQQELQAMVMVCELAKYANRMQAEQPCQYFIAKYQAAVDAEKAAKK